MKKYEEILDKMHFTIGSTLMDNNFCRKGVGGIEPLPESEILRSSRRTYMDLKVLMMRLERELFGERNEEDQKQVPDRDTRRSEDTDDGYQTSNFARVGNFSC